MGRDTGVGIRLLIMPTLRRFQGRKNSTNKLLICAFRAFVGKGNDIIGANNLSFVEVSQGYPYKFVFLSSDRVPPFDR